tara:strand:+ start:450 stop:671 length:222 start_codon:yes stop_codon:yes gene_type:complete
MKGQKKVTYKELNSRMDIAFTKLLEMHKNMDYLHTVVLKYISFNGHEAKFLEFVKKERETIEAKVREDERKVK